MMKIYFETEIDLPLEKVRDAFSEELFAALKPPLLQMETARFDGCREGDEIHLKMKAGLIKGEWVSVVTETGQTDREWFFVDEGKNLPWPLSSWKHYHRVVKVSEQSCKIIDDMNFECKPSALTPVVHPVMWLMFSVRPFRYQKFFEELA